MTTNRHWDPQDSRFHDPAQWDAASYPAHQIADLEPMSYDVSAYREGALSCLRLLGAIDSFMMASKDSRLAWCTVALVLDLTSVRPWTEAELAGKLGLEPATVHRSVSKFRKMSGVAEGSRRIPARV